MLFLNAWVGGDTSHFRSVDKLTLLRMLKASLLCKAGERSFVLEKESKDVSLDLKPFLLDNSVHWSEERGVSHALHLKIPGK